MKHHINGALKLATVPAIVLAIAACGDFLEVTNPGQIDAEGLTDRIAVPGLVVGMSADLSLGLMSIANDGSIMTEEHRNGATGTGARYIDEGIIRPEGVNSFWDGMHRARWVAESGIVRLKTILGDDFDTDPSAPRAHLYAAYSNRILGEYFCEAVIDGGGAQSHTVHFERAQAQFTEARRLAELQGRDDWVNAAVAGLAQVSMGLGEWTAAAAHAEQVPTDFVFEAVYSSNSGRENNQIFHDTHRAANSRFTVHGTPWEDITDDPRVPWELDLAADGSIRLTPNRERPAYVQHKYIDLGANIALAKGTEMLLIRAEAALRASQVQAAIDLIDEQRAYFQLDPIGSAASEEEAWAILQHERGAVLWLEGRRLGDLRRWFAEGRHDFLSGRATCIPISERERLANENLS